MRFRGKLGQAGRRAGGRKQGSKEEAVGGWNGVRGGAFRPRVRRGSDKLVVITTHKKRPGSQTPLGHGLKQFFENARSHTCRWRNLSRSLSSSTLSKFKSVCARSVSLRGGGAGAAWRVGDSSGPSRTESSRASSSSSAAVGHESASAPGAWDRGDTPPSSVAP